MIYYIIILQKRVGKITILANDIDFMDICKFFASNDVIIAICSITSLIGFAMTIYVSIKTKSIDRRIEELNSTKYFNRSRKSYITSLKTYQTSLVEDNIDINKIKMDILNDVNVIIESYQLILNYKQRRTITRLRRKLQKKNIKDKNRICNLLSEIIAYLSNKKEN